MDAYSSPDYRADQANTAGHSRTVNTAVAGSRKSKRSMSVIDFKTISAYKAPHEDHSYHIKHGTRIGDGQKNLKIDKHSYMGQLLTRARSSIDPRKYTPQVNWDKNSR